MEAKVRTLDQIFNNAVRLMVPLYQRPYVWEKTKQWVPLWEDVSAVADKLYDKLAAGVAPRKAQTEVTPHFLGAVVLQRLNTAIGEMDQHAIIDGQQRLTTLQLLLNAAHSAVRAEGDQPHAALLSAMVTNTNRVQSEVDRFKVWPTNNDRAAFREVMSTDGVIDYKSLTHTGARVVDAHAYFAGAIRDWMAASVSDDDRKMRVEALTMVLLGMLAVVAIELGTDENAQLIFETLNARNTQLLASDLIKNALFQSIEEREQESEPLYEKHSGTR